MSENSYWEIMLEDHDPPEDINKLDKFNDPLDDGDASYDQQKDDRLTENGTN